MISSRYRARAGPFPGRWRPLAHGDRRPGQQRARAEQRAPGSSTNVNLADAEQATQRYCYDDDILLARVRIEGREAPARLDAGSNGAFIIGSAFLQDHVMTIEDLHHAVHIDKP